MRWPRSRGGELFDRSFLLNGDRLATIRLRMTIGRELDDRGITTPAAIGAALEMPAAEVTKLLTQHQWREGDVALLEAVAARLGVQVPDQRRFTTTTDDQAPVDLRNSAGG
jgi:hypothetical protein